MRPIGAWRRSVIRRRLESLRVILTGTSVRFQTLSSRRWQTRPMGNETLLAKILDLPPEERIDLLADAWDATAATPEDVPVPEWHLRELERRLADPAPEYVSWKELRERLERSSPDSHMPSTTACPARPWK